MGMFRDGANQTFSGVGGVLLFCANQGSFAFISMHMGGLIADQRRDTGSVVVGIGMLVQNTCSWGFEGECKILSGVVDVNNAGTIAGNQHIFIR